MRTRNFTEQVVEAAPAQRLALIELDRAGGRRAWTFGEVAEHARGLSGTLAEAGVGRGDVVMTVIGNRSEWVFAMLAAFRLGATVVAATEQLRAADLAWRLEVAKPALVIADARNREELAKAAPACPVLWVPDPDLFAAGSAPEPARLGELDPAIISFTSGTSGKPKAIVHGQRYLWGQSLQAEHWLAPDAGELVWCTASSGWSKSARNAFIAPWLRGAAGLLHDGRFDPAERLEIVRREQVDVLCMSPTEYRTISRRAELGPVAGLRRMVAAGERLDAATVDHWRESTGLTIIDGYGQTETGHLTYPGDGPVPGSMGFPLPGVEFRIEGGELVLDPSTVPTFFLSVLGDQPPAGPWRTGDRVEVDEDGRLWFESRADDVILSSGYRIAPGEVESVLLSHEAVEDSAVVGAPDPDRGEIVRAFVVLKEGWSASEELIAGIQQHAKQEAAPYRYPRDVRFVESLPRTASGKLMRSRLREEEVSGAR